MSFFETVELAQVPNQPWRNGGGLTREMLVWPDPYDWKLRVSVARIDQSGAFSSFWDIDRWIALIDGAGICLYLPRGEKTIVKGDAPLFFEGEAAPHCTLLEGPTLDLNLMVRRGAGTSQMAVARRGSALESRTMWRGLFAAGEVLLEIEGVDHPLRAGTLVWSDRQDGITWRIHERSLGLAWWMWLET